MRYKKVCLLFTATESGNVVLAYVTFFALLNQGIDDSIYAMPANICISFVALKAILYTFFSRQDSDDNSIIVM